MKKVFIVVFCSLLASTSFAYTVVKNGPIIDDFYPWTFNNLSDGLVFLIGNYSDRHSVEITVDPMINDKPSDPITVHCNATVYHLTPGQNVVCQPNFVDVAYMGIERGDLKNGASGTYRYTRSSHR